MNPTPQFFVRVGAQVRGPYDVAQLQQLAEVAVVSRATEASPQADGPWITLSDHPESAAIFPARMEFVLKPTKAAVGRDHALPPVEVPTLIAAVQIPSRLLRPAEAVNNPPPAAPKPAAPLNEVEALVRDVRDREAQFAPPPPPPPKRRMPRRLKLVAVLAVVGNGVLLAIPSFYEAWNHDWSMIVFRGWFVIFNGGLLGLYFALPKE